QTVAAKRRHVPRCQLGDHVERLRTVLDAEKLDLHWTSEHRPRVCLRPFERKDRAIAIREDQLLFWHIVISRLLSVRRTQSSQHAGWNRRLLSTLFRSEIFDRIHLL